MIRVTFVYSTLSVALEFTLGLGLALAVRAGLRRGLPGFPLIRVLALAPLLVAPLLWAFYFRSFYSPQFGLFNAILNGIGLPSVLWVNDADIAIYSLVLADVWQWTPFMFSILLAGLLALPGRRGRGGPRRRRSGLAHPLLDRAADAAAGAARRDPDPHDRFAPLSRPRPRHHPGRSGARARRSSTTSPTGPRSRNSSSAAGAALAFVVFALVMIVAGALLRVMWKNAQ